LRRRAVGGAVSVVVACLLRVSATWAQSGEATTNTPDAPRPQPGTRAAALRELRDEKAQQLEAYRAGRLERFLLSIDKAETPSILDLHYAGFYPRVGRQSRNAGLSGGVRYWYPEIAGTALDLHGSAFLSVRQYQLYDMQFGVLPHRENQLPLRSWRGDDVYELGDVDRIGFRPLTVYASLRYRNRPEEIYFGLGPDSPRGDRSSYLLEDATYDLVVGYQASRWLSFTLHMGYRTFAVRSGRAEGVPIVHDLFDDEAAPGLEEQPDYWHFTPQLFLDFRDEPGNPHRGFMLGVAYSNANNRGNEAFRFERFAADARAFVPLGSYQRVLALRTLLNFDQTPPNHRVPFYLQGSLGSSHTLRGYDSFRLRGEDLALFQAEYRWEAAPAIEFTVFTDGGTVSQLGASVDLSTLRWDYGYGIRLKSYRAVLFRFDHAFGDERSRALFRVSSGF
jgi:hypothetical protein